MVYRAFGSQTKIRVGLHRIGLVGLPEAILEVDESGETDEGAVADLLLDLLATHNYVPRDDSEYREAVLREYLRWKRRDFSHLFTEVALSVRGDAGPELDRFLEDLRTVLAGFEMKPDFRLELPEGEGPFPQVLLNGAPLVRGALGLPAIEKAVSEGIADW